MCVFRAFVSPMHECESPPAESPPVLALSRQVASNEMRFVIFAIALAASGNRLMVSMSSTYSFCLQADRQLYCLFFLI